MSYSSLKSVGAVIILTHAINGVFFNEEHALATQFTVQINS